MDMKRAIELLKQNLTQISNLREPSLGNQPFQLWFKKVCNILDLTFGKDSREYNNFVRAVSVQYIVNSDEEKRKIYNQELDAYETALRSAIHKGELLIEEEQPPVSSLSPEAFIVRADWKSIHSGFGISKNSFGRKINFITDSFKRTIIFRDVEQAFILASSGFSKPAVILAGGVIEELLRLYLEHKQIKPIKNDFDGYIQTCEQHRLLKDSVSRLSHSVRQFRNLVHLSAEETKKHTISKATAVGAVSSIFTIANDF